MLPDIHTSSIRDNQTGAEGMITQRQNYRYMNGYKEIFGKLNKATVVHVTSLDRNSGPDLLLTLEQYHDLVEKAIDSYCETQVKGNPVSDQEPVGFLNPL